MTLAVQNAVGSTLAAVIGQVIDAFADMGDATPIMVGKLYLERVGSAPRIVFVPEPAGKVGPPRELGYSASIAHGCDVYIRGAESGDDLHRFDEAYRLERIVIDCVNTAATGSIEWGARSDNSPTDADAFGAEVKLSFTFTTDVPHDERRWALPAASADASLRRVGVPPGVPGTVDSVDVTTVPVED